MSYGHGFALLEQRAYKPRAHEASDGNSGELSSEQAAHVAKFKAEFSEFPRVASATSLADILEAMPGVSAALYMRGDEIRGDRAVDMHEALAAELKHLGEIALAA